MAGRSRRGRSNANAQALRGARGSGAGNARGNAATNQAIAPKKSGGILGWFQSAGDKVANTFHNVTDAVGGAIDTTKTFAKDAWDVVQSTDLSYEDGKIGVETDLDEVMDLLPESYRDKLQLGDDAENRMGMTFDTKTGGMNLTSDNLDIESMDLAGIKSGPANFQGVNIDIGNASEALGLRDNDGGVNIDASVQAAHIQNLEMNGEDGPISIADLNVSDFKANGSNGDGLPFGDATSTSASFSAGSANLSGIQHGAGSLENISVTDIAGGLSERDEVAWMEVAKAQTSGVQGPNGVQLEDGSASDVRVDIRNQGGGMVFLDDKADHMQAHVTAGGLSLDDLSAKQGQVAQMSASGLSLDANQDDGSLSARLAGLNASDLKSGDHAVGSASAQNAQVQLQGGNVNASASAVTVNDLKSGDHSLGRASLNDGQVQVQGDRIEMSAAQLNAGDLKSGDHALGSASAQNTQVQLQGGNVNASASAVTVNDLKSGEHTLDSASLNDGQVQVQGDKIEMSAAQLHAGGLQSGEHALGSASATNTRAQISNGSTNVSADELKVRDIHSGDIHVGTGTASNASAKISGGTTELSADKIGMSDFDANQFHAGGVQANQAQASISAEGITAGVGNASVSDASIRDTLAIDQASVSGVSGTIRGDKRSTDVQSATVQGLTHLPTGSTVASGSLTGLHGESEGDALKASLQSGSVAGVTSGDVQVGGATVQGVNYQGDSDQKTGSADRITLDDAQYGNTASVKSAVATGAQAQFGKGGPSGGLDHLDASGLTFNTPASSGGSSGSSVDTARLLQTASQRVDDADVAVSVPMAAGEYKTGVGLDVERDSHLDARMSIRDNHLTDVNAQFSNPVDGPLWTSLNGLYTKNNTLKADVGGFFDQTISDDINGSMGLEGKGLKSIGTYGNAVANQMGNAAAPTAQSGKPGLQEAFDLDAMSLNANARLSAGTIDAGVGSVTLQNGGANTNTIQASSKRGGDVNVSAQQLKASEANLGVGDLNLSTGQTVLDDTRVRAGDDGVSGQVGNVSVDDLTFK